MQHATYPSTIQHHPGFFGGLLGALLGVVLTLALLVVMDRVDLSITQEPTIPAAATEVTQARHFTIEHRADMPVTVTRHFVLEHRADLAL